MTETIDWEKLRAPFAAADIEWRVNRSGKKGDKVWAMVLAYVDNRAIQDRLDEVAGHDNWQNEFVPWGDNAQLCGISIRANGEWVTKYDGAPNTHIEAVKGGLSDSMKRAAVQWSIGRDLYKLTEMWATVSEKGEYRDKLKLSSGGDESYRWDPPPLPAWALPERTTSPKPPKAAAAKTPASPRPPQKQLTPEEFKALTPEEKKAVRFTQIATYRMKHNTVFDIWVKSFDDGYGEKSLAEVNGHINGVVRKLSESDRYAFRSKQFAYLKEERPAFLKQLQENVAHDGFSVEDEGKLRELISYAIVEGDKGPED